jgi:excisionase family DNA binding protein
VTALVTSEVDEAVGTLRPCDAGHCRIAQGIAGAVELEPTDRVAASVRTWARLLDLSHPTIYQEIHAGRLRSFKVGARRRLISRAAIDEWIRAREAEA